MRVVRGLRVAFQLMIVLALACGLGRYASGQAPTATVEGTVADRSGLVLTTAHIVLTDIATGARREASVEGGGRFHFAALPVGDYSLRIDSAGFAAFVEEQIHLSVSEAAHIDARLSPATQQETVVVNSSAETIDLATNTLGKTVTEREIVNLPLNGRNFSQLGLLQTGVAPLMRAC